MNPDPYLLSLSSRLDPELKAAFDAAVAGLGSAPDTTQRRSQISRSIREKERGLDAARGVIANRKAVAALLEKQLIVLRRQLDELPIRSAGATNPRKLRRIIKLCDSYLSKRGAQDNLLALAERAMAQAKFNRDVSRDEEEAAKEEDIARKLFAQRDMMSNSVEALASEIRMLFGLLSPTPGNVVNISSGGAKK